jgi:short-subunit dehydrogenase involved in D-alanine esterification of teichoic acids
MNTKINKFFNFKNKVVLITGSNGIIGKQLCNFYLDQEAFVFGIDTKKKLIKIKNYQHFQGDAANENFLLKKINFIVKKKSKIDIILNCAGIQFFTHFEKRTKKERRKND